MGSAERVPGREHFPRYPKGFIVLRILQLILTIILLGLTAYTMAVVIFVSNSLMIFTSLASLVVTVWLVTVHSCAPQGYNYWAVLVLDIFLFLFWLVSFILMAISAAWLFVADGSYCSYYTCYSFSLTDAELAFASIVGAAAGLGAINCLLFFISLIIHSCVVCSHRRNGLHSKISRGHITTTQGGFPMNPQPHSNYTAVPQQGMPVAHPYHHQHQHQQDTAYNPNQMYSPPTGEAVTGYPPQSASSPPPSDGFYQMPPQSFYGAPAPVTQQPMSPQQGADQFAKSPVPTVAHSVYEVPGHQVYQNNPHQPPAYYPPNQNQNQ